ncbi:MAG: glycosyltransferase family 4 protein [Syntrophaceae bacterium]|nr:glycosyltransferase family 4 protein [Syntrophaceae bacterium]
MVIPKYGLLGGAEQFAAELTDRLISATGFDFHVYANRWEKSVTPITFEKVPIISFPKFLTTPSFAYFTGCRIKRNNFSIVHSHERIFGADIFTLHGIPHRYWVRHIRRKQMSLYDLATAWVEKKLVYEGNCKKFIAVSSLTKDIFLQEYKIDPDLVDIIHPGVDLNEYVRQDKTSVRHSIRRELGINNVDPVILFASMNFEIKGLDNIMFSLAKLKAQNRKFKLIVAGKGNIKKYTQLAQEAKIIEDVIFTGPVNKEKLIKMYLAGDLYIMLSKFDTFGMVVLEAMAAGLPVIISSNVGAKDLVREGENGFVINDTTDSDYIAAKITLLCDENIRRPLAEKACQTATQNTWDQVASRYKEIYMSIIANRKRNPAS